MASNSTAIRMHSVHLRRLYLRPEAYLHVIRNAYSAVVQAFIEVVIGEESLLHTDDQSRLDDRYIRPVANEQDAVIPGY
jgi:hypothetical protein